MCINSLLPLILPTSTIQHTLLLHSGVFFKDCVKPTSSQHQVILRVCAAACGTSARMSRREPSVPASLQRPSAFPHSCGFTTHSHYPNRSIFISGLYVFIPHNSRSPSTPAFHVYYVILTYDDISTFAQVVAQYPCKL